jgi:hypothetical protein
LLPHPCHRMHLWVHHGHRVPRNQPLFKGSSTIDHKHPQHSIRPYSHRICWLFSITRNLLHDRKHHLRHTSLSTQFVIHREHEFLANLFFSCSCANHWNRKCCLTRIFFSSWDKKVIRRVCWWILRSCDDAKCKALANEKKDVMECGSVVRSCFHYVNCIDPMCKQRRESLWWNVIKKASIFIHHSRITFT